MVDFTLGSGKERPQGVEVELTSSAVFVCWGPYEPGGPRWDVHLQ